MKDWENKDTRNDDWKYTALIDSLKENTHIEGLKEFIVSQLLYELKIENTYTIGKII